MLVYSLIDTWSDNSPKMFASLERLYQELNEFKHEFPNADIENRFEIQEYKVIE